MSIDPKEFGKLIANVENLVKSFDKHADDIKELFKVSDQRLDDHKTNQDEEQDKIDDRISKLEKFTLMLTSKWSVLALIAGLIVWPILMPILQEIVAGMPIFQSFTAYADII